MRFIAIAVIVMMAVSCSPVHRVLTNEKMYEQVKKAVIAKGDCVVDSTKEVKDSISYKLLEGVKVPCKDFEVTSGGLKVLVKDSLVTLPQQIKEVKITVRDRGYESTLKDTIHERDRTIVDLQKDKVNLSAENKKLRKEVTKKNLQIIGMLTLAFIIIFRKPLLALLKNALGLLKFV